MMDAGKKLHLNIAGCFIRYSDTFLLLHRQDNKSQGGRWGIPAGKIELGEEPLDAVIREVHEEIGIVIPPSAIRFLEKMDWDFDDKTVSFSAFETTIAALPEIHLAPDEHQAYEWVDAEECYARTDLMHGVQDLLVRVGYIK